MKKSRILIFVLPILLLSLVNIGGLYAHTKSLEVQEEATSFTPWKFIALGDTRNAGADFTGIEITTDLIDSLLVDNEVEFILHNGDVVDKGGEQDQWDIYWSIVNSSTMMKDIPVYYAPGNHEYSRESGGYDIDLEVYHANVDLPGNEIFYSFSLVRVYKLFSGS